MERKTVHAVKIRGMHEDFEVGDCNPSSPQYQGEIAIKYKSSTVSL